MTVHTNINFMTHAATCGIQLKVLYTVYLYFDSCSMMIFFWKNECILPDYSHPIKKRIGITTRINTTLHKLKKPTSLVHTL